MKLSQKLLIPFFCLSILFNGCNEYRIIKEKRTEDARVNSRL